MPTGLAGADEIDDAAFARKVLIQVSQIWQHDISNGTSDRPRRRRRADLVGNDAQLFALGPKPRDGAQEVRAFGGVDPGGARGQMRTAGRANGSVAGKPARAIDRKPGPSDYPRATAASPEPSKT